MVLKDLGRFGFRSYRLPLGEPGTYEMGPTGYTLSGGPVTPKNEIDPRPNIDPTEGAAEGTPNARNKRRDF